MTGFATKEELAQLKGAMTTGFAEVRGDLARFKGELEVKISEFKGELEVKISDVTTDVIRWMFALFVTMLIAILGLYFKK